MEVIVPVAKSKFIRELFRVGRVSKSGIEVYKAVEAGAVGADKLIESLSCLLVKLRVVAAPLDRSQGSGVDFDSTLMTAVYHDLVLVNYALGYLLAGIAYVVYSNHQNAVACPGDL